MNKIVAAGVVVLLASFCSAAEYDIFMVSGGGTSNAVLRIDETNGSVIGQVPMPANFRPARIRASGDGNIYVTSLLDHGVVKINPLTGEVLQQFSLTSAYGVAVGDSALYVGSVASGQPRRVHRLGFDGSDLDGDGFPIGTYQDNIPIDMKLSPGGDLFVAASRLRKYDPITGAPASFALSNPSSGLEPSGGFFTFGPDGDIFVSNNTSISRYNADGAFEAVFATGLSGIGGSQGTGTIAFGPNGNLYASDLGSRLVEFDGTTGAVAHSFNLPAGDFAFVQVPEPALGIAPLLLLSLRRRRRSHRARQGCDGGQ